MSRIPPVHWKQLKCIFEKDGFTFAHKKHKKGSHWVGSKPGVARAVVVPEYDEIVWDIIHSNMRTAGMSRERYLELLAQC